MIEPKMLDLWGQPYYPIVCQSCSKEINSKMVQERSALHLMDDDGIYFGSICLDCLDIAKDFTP